MSFKGLHYGIDRALVRLNAESGGSSEKKKGSAVNAQYMCMEYSRLVFVYVGVCGLRCCFILKCLFGHHVLFRLAGLHACIMGLCIVVKCTNTPFCFDQDFGNMTNLFPLALLKATGGANGVKLKARHYR